MLFSSAEHKLFGLWDLSFYFGLGHADLRVDSSRDGSDRIDQGEQAKHRGDCVLHSHCSVDVRDSFFLHVQRSRLIIFSFVLMCRYEKSEAAAAAVGFCCFVEVVVDE